VEHDHPLRDFRRSRDWIATDETVRRKMHTPLESPPALRADKSRMTPDDVRIQSLGAR
jgi:hypothetical protein